MAKCNIQFEKFNKEVGKSETYYQLDEIKQDLLDKQITANTTIRQKKLADALVREHSKVIGVNDNNYIDATGTPYMRVSRFIKNLRSGYYAFDDSTYDESDYEDQRQRGNMIDSIFEGFIAGKSLKEVKKDAAELLTGIEIDDDVFTSINTIVTKLRAKHPGSIMLPQLTLTHSTKIGGSLDLLVIDTDGSMTIYDLKTSDNPITEEWTKNTISGSFKEYYNKVFVQKNGTRKASKKQRHAAQLSTYKAMVEEVTGDEVDNLAIIPVQIGIDENDNIAEIKEEAIYNHDADTKLVESLKALESKEEVINKLDDLTNTDFLQEVVNILQEKAKRLKKEGKFSGSVKIESIIENINMGEGMTKLSEFIEYLYNDYVTGDNNLNKRFNTFMDGVDLDSDSSMVLSELGLLESEIGIFREIVSELQSIYDDLELSKVQDIQRDSDIDKLDKIISAFNSLERKAKKTILPTVAKILARELPSDKEKAKLEPVIDRLRKRLNKTTLSPRVRRNLEEKLAVVLDKYNESEKTILEALETGNYKDISAISYRLNPAISMNNTIIATFAKSLKRRFEEMRVKLLSLEKIAGKAFDEFAKASGLNRNNVEEFNKDFYEVINANGKEYYSLVQKLDYAAYSAAMDSLDKEAEEKAKIAKKKEKKYKDTPLKSLKYFFKNELAIKYGYRVALKPEDETIKNPYTGEEIVLREGYVSIYTKSAARKTGQSLDNWILSQFDNVNGKLVPKGKQVTKPNDDMFRNPKWNNIHSKDNPHKEKYYNFLLATYRKAQSNVEGEPMFYRLPGIEKVSNDRIRENGPVDWGKRFIEKTFHYTYDEQEEYGDKQETEKDEGNKIIPHMYNQYLPLKDTSLDLIGSILRYSAAAERYNVQAGLEPFGSALLKQVSDKAPQHSPSHSIKNLKVGGRPLNHYFKKHNKNNTAALIEAMIDTHIYGKYRVKEELGGIAWNKITDAAMGFASFTMIGGKPILAVSNSLAAQVSTAIDVFAKENLNAESWLWAKGVYNKNELEFINDSTSTVKKSKISQLAELYDALQGEYFDQYGRKMSQGAIKKYWGSKLWFAGMHKGEHRAQVQVMLALLHSNKVKTKSGKEISLYDAYEVGEDGVIKVRDDVKMELLNFDIQNKIHAMNKRFNGVYNQFDKPELERHNIGILLSMYRKFIVPNVRRRFKSWGVDYESGDEYEGYYNTFISKLMSESKELWKMLSGQENELTDHERANIRRTLTEIAFMILLSSLSMIDADDDDDEGIAKLKSYTGYLFSRSVSELSLYNFGLGDVRTFGMPVSLVGSFRAFRTPSPIYSVIEKGFKAAKYSVLAVGGSPDAIYERDVDYKTVFGDLGEKGDSKAIAAWTKLLGLNGQLYSVETARKLIEKDR